MSSSIKTVTLVSLVPADLYIRGEVSGTVYHFPQSGSVVKVNAKDAEILLAKRSPRPCCGGQPGALFEQLKEA